MWSRVATERPSLQVNAAWVVLSSGAAAKITNCDVMVEPAHCQNILRWSQPPPPVAAEGESITAGDTLPKIKPAESVHILVKKENVFILVCTGLSKEYALSDI